MSHYLYRVVSASLKNIIQFILRFRIIHVCVWLYAFLSDLHLLQTNRPDAAHAVVNYIDAVNNIVWQMVAAYLVILVWFPRYFIKEKAGQFILYSLLTVMITAFLNVLTQIGYLLLFIKPGFHIIPSIVFITMFAKIFDIFFYSALFFIVVLVWHYFQKDQRNKKVERDHLLNELEFLKAQMNPHFVFNAINSIYVLMKIDTRSAEDVLLRFSSLLRYQLYECGQGEAWLSKEIAFIKDYTELEKIRLGDRYRVEINIGAPKEYYRIAPFVLFPFVENAFKHISHREDQLNTVTLNIRFQGNNILFDLWNTVEQAPAGEKKEGGIGLRNVQRRLELLYPDKHILKTGIIDNVYHVHLEIELHENQMHHY